VGGVFLLNYEVWVDNGNGDFSAVISPYSSPNPTDSSLLIQGLTTGTTYGIKMRAINQIGTGQFSDIVYLVCADKPNAPNPPTAEERTKSSIILSWNPPSSNGGSVVNGYNIYINDLSVGDW